MYYIVIDLHWYIELFWNSDFIPASVEISICNYLFSKISVFSYIKSEIFQLTAFPVAYVQYVFIF